MNIATKSLQSVLSRCKPAISSRITLPILGHVRLIAKNGMLTASATNCDIWIDATEPCEGELDLCLPFERLWNGCKVWSGESVSITTEKGVAHVRCGKSLHPIPFMASDEYKDAPGDALPAPILAPKLAEVVERCLPFTSDISGEKAILSGVHLGKNKAEGYFTGCLIQTATEFDGQGAVLSQEACAAIEGLEGDCTLRIGESLVQVHAEGCLITARRMAGTFPDTSPAFPKGDPHSLVLSREEMADALADIGTSEPDLKYGNVLFRLEKDSAVLSMTKGMASREIGATWDGEPMDMAISHLRLTMLLRAFKEPAIFLSIIDHKEPVVCEENGSTIVIQPIRLK